VRQIRGEMNIKPSKAIPVLLKGASAQDAVYAGRHLAYLEKLAGLQSVTVLAPDAEAPESATALVGELSILVPMAGLIDVAAEAERIGKVLTKTRQDLSKTQLKLTNDNFVRNAPPAVVATERERETGLQRDVANLTAQMERLKGLLKS
jgi:valyl-tRNA synthetase